ncbi:MAG: hypothetical protein JWO94_279 [Verrucomicrobiaceae bacterium]|nr:hypothetical protein [Verrucomicrobiaceae bacterium]
MSRSRVPGTEGDPPLYSNEGGRLRYDGTPGYDGNY